MKLGYAGYSSETTQKKKNALLGTKCLEVLRRKPAFAIQVRVPGVNGGPRVGLPSAWGEVSHLE